MGVYIDYNFMFQTQSEDWLRCITASNQPGVQTPDTERVSAQSGQREQGDRDTVRVSAQSGHRKGGPRHYDRRTEVWRGCTPKVSEFEGCSEPSPIRFVGGGAHLKTDL